MKRIVCFVMVYGCCLLASSTDLPQKFNRMLSKRHSSTHMAVWVGALPSGKPIYKTNALHSLVPASTQKFVTAVAALLTKGAKWRYSTDLSVYGHQHQDVLKGRVVLKFSGDPTLQSEDIMVLLKQLKARGINTIQGVVVLDVAAFGVHRYGRGWLWDDLTECFATPVSSVILDDNCLHLQFSMTAGQNRPRVTTYPRDVALLVNDLASTPMAHVGCVMNIVPAKHNHYTLTGCVPNKTAKWTRNVAIWNPTEYARMQVRHMLGDLNITVSEGVVVSRDSNRLGQSIWRWKHKSKSLRQLLATMLKVSDNLIANSLFRVVGRQKFGDGASWQQASIAVKEVLQRKLGVKWPKNSLFDGAGLSLYNRVNASILGATLAAVYRKSTLRRQLLPLLAIAGIDGTVRNRFRKSPVKNRFFGKTGTMSGVSGLIGYLHTAADHWLAVVLLSQGRVDQKYAYRRSENRVINRLYQQR